MEVDHLFFNCQNTAAKKNDWSGEEMLWHAFTASIAWDLLSMSMEKNNKTAEELKLAT